jgi:hypothetical protein
MSESENEAEKGKAELQSPDTKLPSFRANGKTYLLEKKISIARKIECDKLLIEVTGGGNMGENFSDWKKVYELCNDKKFADIAVLAHNRMEGVKKWQDRHDPVLSLCTLFINEESEDRRIISAEMISAKIKDWEAAGIEYTFFLTMANGLLKNLTATWNDSSRSTSEEGPD